jgi:hypothetical protein
MSNGIIEDANGNKSSKRIMGISMIGFSMLLALILFGFSISTEVKNAYTIIDIIKLFIYSGTGLLGIGVVENFAIKPSDKNIS